MKTTKNLFKAVVINNFFKNYCPEVKCYYHKTRGISGNGTPIDFTDSDKAKIKEGVKKLITDLSRF